MQVQYYPMGAPQLLYPIGSHQMQVPSQPQLLPGNPAIFTTYPLMLQAQLQPQAAYFAQSGNFSCQLAASAAALHNSQTLLAGLGIQLQPPTPAAGAVTAVPPPPRPPQQQQPGAPDQERAVSHRGGQDYSAKLLTWLKTHRMHKYYDRLRKYNFDQLLGMDRTTLEAEQFTQGAIKKLLGMVERVRQDRAAFDCPTRSSGSPASSGEDDLHSHRPTPYGRRRPPGHQQLQQLQLLSMAALAQRHHQHQHQQHQQQQLLLALSAPFLSNQLS